MSPATILVAHSAADLYGSSRMLLESVEGFVATGARVVVTIAETGPLAVEVEARGAEVVICATPVLRRSLLSPLGFFRLTRQSASAIAESVKLLRSLRPAVVYVNTLTIPLWPILARITGHRVVIHVHESESNDPMLIRRVLNLPLFSAHTIVTNSRCSSRVLVDTWRRLEGRYTIIYNGVPGPSRVTTPREDVGEGVRLLCVGRLSHRKGVAVVIESLAELRRRGMSARLDIVGAVFPGNEDFESGLQRMILDLNLEDSVTFHGFQSPVWPFVEAADIVVIPSRLDESFGNTAIEGILAGRPVIVSDISGLQEAAGAYGCARFVPPSDSHSLADAVADVAREWSRYSAIAVTDAETAASRHDPAVYRRQIASAVLGKPVEVLPATVRSSRSAKT